MEFTEYVICWLMMFCLLYKLVEDVGCDEVSKGFGAFV